MGLSDVFSRNQPGQVGSTRNDIKHFKIRTSARLDKAKVPPNVTMDNSYETCTMSPDEALWIQLSHFFKQNMSSPQTLAEAQMFSLDHIPKVNVKVLKEPNFNQVTGFGTSVVLRIEEQLKPSMKKFEGGSFYRVEVRGSTYKYICPVQSHFDGTYTICCYLQPECSTIVITLKYVNYAPFWDHVPLPLTKKVYYNVYCPPKEMTNNVKFMYPCSARELQRTGALGRWILPEFDNKMTWAVGNCFVDPDVRFNRTYWESCLANKRSMNL